MRTPFDTALRVQHRAVETIRVAISLEIAKQGDLEQVEGRLVDQVRSETALAARFALPASSEWLARMRARRHQLRGEVEASGVRVAALRAKAAEAYGAMRAIEDAADRHRIQQHRAQHLPSALARARRFVSALPLDTFLFHIVCRATAVTSR